MIERGKDEILKEDRMASSDYANAINQLTKLVGPVGYRDVFIMSPGSPASIVQSHEEIYAVPNRLLGCLIVSCKVSEWACHIHTRLTSH